MKIFNDTIGNRTRDLPDFSAVPQPSASPRASRSAAAAGGGGVSNNSSSSSRRINTYFSVYFQTLLKLSKIAHI